MIKHIFIVLVLILAGASAQSRTCVEEFSNQSWFERRTTEKTFDYDDDISYFKARRRQADLGNMRSFFDSELDTRIYSSTPSTVENDGKISLISPKSKALYIFFHGSGTAKSSGKNFAAQMNELTALGYSSLSFDMPFHADGPMSEKYTNADYFISWTHRIIQKYRNQGQPVFLVGHSFGPDVIAEYLYRHPKSVDGAVMLSPAGFNKVLSDWQEKHTDHMKFGGETSENTAAGEFAAKLSQNFTWNKFTNNSDLDPTVVNPNLKVRMLSGDREEYVPAPTGGRSKTPTGKNTYDISSAFRKFFLKSVITIEPGVGHYLFDHKDSDGQAVVLRELLLLNNENVFEIRKIKEELNKNRSMPDFEWVLVKYNDDVLFKAWIDKIYSYRFLLNVFKNQNHQLAKKIIYSFDLEKSQRILSMIEKLKATEISYPEFYLKLKDILNSKDLNQIDGSIQQYLDYLEFKGSMR